MMRTVSPEHEPPATSTDPGRVVFRITPLAVLGALSLAVCATPVAFGLPHPWLVYLVPLGIIVWVLRVRTVVDTETVRVRAPLRTRRVAWDDIASLRLRSRSRVSAVLTSGAELPLPAVHVRDLPLLSVASGMRLPDPTGTPTETPTETPTSQE